ncbi:MAG: hypothetical protein Q9222_005169 [Ikaeria aurantiellina]
MFQDDQETMRFIAEKSETWKNTVKLETLLHRLNDFSAVYFPGGHGPMFDLVNDAQSQRTAREIYEAGGVVSAVCHGPAALLNVKLSDGSYLLKGSTVTGFTNVEEEQMGLKEHMPYLLEDELKQRSGGLFEMTDPWGSKVVTSADGRIITGQNPGSTAALAAKIHSPPLDCTYLIDIHTLGGRAFTTIDPNTAQTLKAILESDGIPKVFFDVRNDSDALYAHYGIKLAGIKDLQLMELATRAFNKKFVNGLSKCIDKDAGLCG